MFTKNALLNADGSVTTFSGEEISPPDETRAKKYKQMSPWKNEVINADGSTAKIVNVGGETGGVSEHNLLDNRELPNQHPQSAISSSKGNVSLEEDMEDTYTKNETKNEIETGIDKIINNANLVIIGSDEPVGYVTNIGGYTADKIEISGLVYLKNNGQIIKESDYPQLRGKPGVTPEYENKVKVMTSNNSNGQISQATSSTEAGGSLACNAFDENNNSSWQSIAYAFDSNLNGDERIGIQLNESTVLGYYTLRAIIQTAGYQRAPGTWALYGSNDDVLNVNTLENWEIIDNRTVTTFSSGQLLQFSTSNNKNSYKNYMIRVTKILKQPNDTNRVSIAEIELFGETGNLIMPTYSDNPYGWKSYMLAEKSKYINPIRGDNLPVSIDIPNFTIYQALLYLQQQMFDTVSRSKVENGFRFRINEDIDLSQSNTWIDLPFEFNGEINADNIYEYNELFEVTGPGTIRLVDDISDKISDLTIVGKMILREGNWESTTEIRIIATDVGETFEDPFVEDSMSANGGGRNMQYSSAPFWTRKGNAFSDEVLNRGGAVLKFQIKTTVNDKAKAGSFLEISFRGK